MAKFNLSSVYTKDNIYSVLKLLKALIDTLDNYEFQDPIVDANGNQIPMTWFQKLYKSIHGADDGSVAVSKDATINGSLKLGSNTLFAYINYPNSNVGAIPAVFYYDIDAGKIFPRGAIGFDPQEALLLAWFDLGETTYENGVYTTAVAPSTVDLSALDVNIMNNFIAGINAKINNKQDKLYRHALNVKSASYFAVFDFYSTSREPINNTQALTTYLKPTASSVYPCACFANNATPAPANMNAIKYSSNTWKFCLTGGTAETFGDSVLSVSDSVTAVD